MEVLVISWSWSPLHSGRVQLPFSLFVFVTSRFPFPFFFSLFFSPLFFSLFFFLPTWCSPWHDKLISTQLDELCQQNSYKWLKISYLLYYYRITGLFVCLLIPLKGFRVFVCLFKFWSGFPAQLDELCQQNSYNCIQLIKDLLSIVLPHQSQTKTKAW